MDCTLRARLLVTAAVVAVLGGCGMRVGYRASYRDPAANGAYAGPWLALAASTAAKTDPVGSDPYLLLGTDYQLARGPDFSTFAGGVALAPGALGWHNAVTFQLGWQPFRGRGVQLAVCDGYGNWGVVMACARWSSRGWFGFDVGAGLSPTRLAAEAHENCRDGSCDSRSGGGWDFDD